jgi:hypothetical protein
MSIDLVDRIIYLNSKGETEPLERFNKWLNEPGNTQVSDFIVDNQKYYWKIVKSSQFKDIIDEDLTDWFLIYSDRNEFKAIAKKLGRAENLIGEKSSPYISTLWILKSNIESIKVDETPILISSPHWFDSSLNRINYDFKQLITKLKDPKVHLTQFVSYKISKSQRKQIR